MTSSLLACSFLIEGGRGNDPYGYHVSHPVSLSLASSLMHLTTARQGMRGPRSSRDPDAPKAATSAQQFYAKARRESPPRTRSSRAPSCRRRSSGRHHTRWPHAHSGTHTTSRRRPRQGRFEKETSEYTVPVEFLKATKNGNRLQKDPLRPKKPKSAHLYFAEATRAELSGANPGPHRAAVEADRRGVEEAERPRQGPVREACVEEDKERYRKEMEDYTPSEATWRRARPSRRPRRSGAAWNDDSAEERTERSAGRPSRSSRRSSPPRTRRSRSCRARCVAAPSSLGR